LDGATVTATRPHGLAGRPFADLSSRAVQVVPPSVLLKRPLALGLSGVSPPERKVQPLRRKSHMPAKSVRGDEGSIVIREQPVEALVPARTFVQVLPASVVR
jgi:hypothetical protein